MAAAWQFDPPWRDMRFVIEELLGLPARWAAMPAFEAVDAEVARQVIDEAGRFARQVLLPLNASGDLAGCTLDHGEVRTPPGWRDAHQAFVEAGWPALACDVEWGGQGLPQVLNAVLFEMLAATNHAWTMAPGLLHGAYDCLLRHADPKLRERYLPEVVSGRWLATMCLTEPQAGSDLGLITTRATPIDTGRYAISGTKIFISGGEHDLSDNIVHLVLARLPDAPAGSRGLSLFLAPKRLPDGSRNSIACDGIEKKMGIKGSPTCVMRFEAATAWLVGEPHRGLQAMFAMMNAARVHVALQGLGHAEAAWQNARRYAAARCQSRAVGGRGKSGGDPIDQHPAVRRILWSVRARTEGARVLAYEAAHLLDMAEHGDPALAKRAEVLLSLLTPVAKAWLTDLGFHAASDALQVWGGHGYVHEYGIEQTLRDSRIAMIYEGTNEIQAVDLLVRKGVGDGGHALNLLFDWLSETLPQQASHGDAVRDGLTRLRLATARVVRTSCDDAERPYRVADDFLAALGLLLFAHGFARADAVAADALRAAAQADVDFYRSKRETAAFFMGHHWPEFAMRLARVEAGIALPPLPPVA